MSLSNQSTALEQTNYVEILVDQFNEEKQKIKDFLIHTSDLSAESKRVLQATGARFPNQDKAMHLLNVSFWSKIYERSNIKDLLDSEKRSQWGRDLLLSEENNAELPEFTYENVVSTLNNWYSSREMMFADKVDSIFQKLSSSHATNEPMGFNRKMIFKYGCDKPFFKTDVMSLTYAKKEMIYDLIGVISTLINMPTPDRNIINSFSSLELGKRHRIYGGSIEIQVFKNQGMHIWIDPYLAILMNQWLAKKYPSAIPSEQRVHKKNIKVFEYQYEFLSKDDLMVLSNIKEHRFINAAFEGKEAALRFCKYVGITIEDLRKTDRSNEILPAVAMEIMRTGYPSIKSHQYYPTPEAITECISECIGSDTESTQIRVLEPSAGSGNLAKIFKNRDVVDCVEVSPLMCKILKHNGFNHVRNEDFLMTKSEPIYDYVIMNPPYANLRLENHLEHALTFIKDDGVLFLVAPTGKRNAIRAIIGDDHALCVIGTFDKVFEDTKISTSIFQITK